MAEELKQIFEGKWVNYKNEKLEDFLGKMDVGFMKRKLAMSVTPTLTVKVEGESITVSISAGPKSNTNTFKLGVNFDIETEMSGTGVATFEGGKWTTKVTPKDPKKGKAQTVTREVIDGDLVQTMEVEDVTCKRYFKKA